MFVGHLAVSLGAKAVEPRASLSALVGASFGLDLLWPLLLLAGLEVVQVAPGNTAFTPLAFESYPWSHSLFMALVWGVAGGVVAYLATKTQPAAAMVGIVVVSHWVLDFVTHRPDLPLWPGEPRVGLGLWNSVPATLLLEGGFFLAVIAFYARTAKATGPNWPLGSLDLRRLLGNDLGESALVSTSTQRDGRGGNGIGPLGSPCVGALDRAPPTNRETGLTVTAPDALAHCSRSEFA